MGRVLSALALIAPVLISAFCVWAYNAMCAGDGLLHNVRVREEACDLAGPRLRLPHAWSLASVAMDLCLTILRHILQLKRADTRLGAPTLRCCPLHPPFLHNISRPATPTCRLL